MSNYKTSVLSDTVAEIAFEKPSYFYFIHNMSENVCYVSFNSIVSPGSDGVVSVPPGCSFGLSDNKQVSKIYAVGNGSVQICGKNSDVNPFNKLMGGGDNKSNINASDILFNSEDFTAENVDAALNELFIKETAVSVNNISPVDGNVSLTQDDIPDSDTYFRQNYKTQRGLVTPNASGSATITFPTAFTEVPMVFATAIGASNTTYPVSPWNMKKTGCTFKTKMIYNQTLTEGDANSVIQWLAMGV